VLAALCVLTAAGCAAGPRSPAIHSFTIVQFNDVYEIFPVPVRVNGDTERRGGLAYAATMIREERLRGPTLVLHAGDLLGPSVLSTALGHQGAQMIAALNAIGVDAATFGNHEFDDRCRVLARRIAESRFQWLSANVAFPADAGPPADRVARYRVFLVGGLRVGVFGLSLPLGPVGGCGTGAITFRDPLDAAREAVGELIREQVDVVIALTHLPIAVDRALAASLPAIDLIVGGHEHEPMEARVGRTVITKAGANAVALGVITLSASSTRDGRVVTARFARRAVDPDSVAADPEVARALEPYARDLEPFTRVIGRSDVPLDAREEVVREAESNAGDFVADAMRRAMNADVALINGGSFRDDRVIPAGPITLGDLYTALPFPNRLVTVRVSGAELLAALENGVSRSGHKAGRFPQVSGVRMAFNPDAPPGQRIIRAAVGDEPIDPARSYTLATTEYLISRESIDGYALPGNVLQRGPLLNAVLLERLRTASPIRPRLDGRIARGRGGPAHVSPDPTRP
jgi:2',3'-cyclic-nucleotide 2'-phosphodiesterase (5'-nucleotidase family)